MHYLTPATLPKGEVKAGTACLLAAVPMEWVVSVPPIDPLTQMLSGDIILQPGRQWLRMLLVSRRRPLREDLQTGPGGNSWQINISGRTVGQSVAIHEYIRNYTDHRWLILYQEAGTGITYLVGSTRSGARLQAAYNNETATVSAISFAHTSVTRSLIYRGSFTLDNNITIDSGATIGTYLYTANGSETGTPATTFTIPALRSKLILWVSRSGMKDLAAITYTPTNDVEIQYDAGLGSFTVWSELPITPGETFMILYKTT